MIVNRSTKKQFYPFLAKKINKNFNYSLFFSFFCDKIIKQLCFWASRFALRARVGLSAPSLAYISLRFIYASGSATIPLAKKAHLNPKYSHYFSFYGILNGIGCILVQSLSR